MQFTRLIVLGIVAFLGLSCSQQNAPTSSTRSLDELALGHEGDKFCSGTLAPQGFEDRVVYADGVDSGELAPILAQALTAVPLPVRELFRAVGGRILVTPEASNLCDSPSAQGRSLASCFKVGGTLGGKQDDVTIVLAADAAVLASRTVRAYGYVVAQYFSRLYKKNGALELKLGMNESFKSSQEEVGGAFLDDLNLAPAGARATELASRAYAEAFDSWYCQASGPQEMRARYPKTHDAFVRVDASVQGELAEALATFQKQKALRLQDAAAPVEEKINGDLSQAATTEVTGATSSGSDPLISGSTIPEKTFTDPTPTTAQTGDKPAADEPVSGPNDVVVTINADGTVSGAGTDNIANNGQLVVVDNREKPSTDTSTTTTTTTNTATDTTTTTTDTKTPETTTTDKPTTDKPTVPTDKPTDVLTGGSQPSGADQGPPTSGQGQPTLDEGFTTEVPAGSYDPNQTPPPAAGPFNDGGGQVFAGAGC